MLKREELVSALLPVRDELLNLTTRVEELLVLAGGGNNPTGTEDPATSPLGPDGLWVPPRVALLAAKAEALYPGGVKQENEYDFATGQWRRGTVAWPVGFYASASIYPTNETGVTRLDLTDKQRAKLQEMHNLSVGPVGAMQDTGMSLCHVPLGNYPLQGGYVAALPVTYTNNLERLWRDIDGFFAKIGVTL